MTIEQATVTSPDTQTCPDCLGAGEFVTGPYSRTCGECQGEGVRVVTAKCDACGDSYPAGAGTLFRFWSGKADDLLCPGCTAEALTDPENYTRVGDEPTPPARLDTPELLAEMAADEYAHDAETLRWATVRAEAQRVSDPFIARQIAARRTTVRAQWVEAI